MYIKSSNGRQYLEKSGSWSLRGDRRGFNNSPVVVFDRKLLEENPGKVRGILVDQKNLLIDRRQEIEKTIAPKNANIASWRQNIKHRAKHNRNYCDSLPKHKKLTEEYLHLGEQIKGIESQIKELRESDPNQHEVKFPAEFCNVAAEHLTKDEFNKLKKITLDRLNEHE